MRKKPTRSDSVVAAVQSCLTDDLRRPVYRGHENPLRGHCAVASEAVYFILGGKSAGWTPATIKIDNDTHWFLRHRKTGQVVDPTAGQFACEVEYGRGRGRGFPTPGTPQPPSKRAAQVITCARAKLRKR